MSQQKIQSQHSLSQAKKYPKKLNQNHTKTWVTPSFNLREIRNISLMILILNITLFEIHWNFSYDNDGHSLYVDTGQKCIKQKRINQMGQLNSMWPLI